jgi:uncharacterized membrane protein
MTASVTARNPLVGPTQRLERSAALDGLRSVYGGLAERVDRMPGSRLLRSGLLGHALHPLLTDLPLGFWTAATALDLRGRTSDRDAGRWLVGAGLVASAPTALTGLAELGRLDREGTQRVGALHGALNAVASALYVTSYVARSRRRHGLGVATALAGAAVTGASGYLGGHLTMARKVGSRDAAYAADDLGPADAAAPNRAALDPLAGPGALT